MSPRTSLLDEYNRALRRRLGQETLTEKLDAMRGGHGFRVAKPAHDAQAPVAAPPVGSERSA
jgi:hypothetical protein